MPLAKINTSKKVSGFKKQIATPARIVLRPMLFQTLKGLCFWLKALNEVSTIKIDTGIATYLVDAPDKLRRKPIVVKLIKIYSMLNQGLVLLIIAPMRFYGSQSTERTTNSKLPS